MGSWAWSRVFGLLGAVGMTVFFVTLVIAGDDAPRAVLLPSGIAMWVGYPVSWWFVRRERERQGAR